MADSAVMILTQMFYEPTNAFEALKDKSRPWLPVIAASLLTAALLYWYFTTVDFNWMVNSMVSAGGDLKPAEAAAMRGQITPGMMMWSAVGGALFGFAFSFALYGAYYLLAAKFLGSDKKFGDWFAFSAWINVPYLLTLPLMALQIATGDGRASLDDLNMTSLNYLLLHLPPSNPWSGLVSGISPAMVWTLALSVIGLRVWTRRSSAECVIASLLPPVIIYGLWAAKIVIFG